MIAKKLIYSLFYLALLTFPTGVYAGNTIPFIPSQIRIVGNGDVIVYGTFPNNDHGQATAACAAQTDSMVLVESGTGAYPSFESKVALILSSMSTQKPLVAQIAGCSLSGTVDYPRVHGVYWYN